MAFAWNLPRCCPQLFFYIFFAAIQIAKMQTNCLTVPDQSYATHNFSPVLSDFTCFYCCNSVNCSHLSNCTLTLFGFQPNYSSRLQFCKFYTLRRRTIFSSSSRFFSSCACIVNRLRSVLWRQFVRMGFSLHSIRSICRVHIYKVNQDFVTSPRSCFSRINMYLWQPQIILSYICSFSFNWPVL